MAKDPAYLPTEISQDFLKLQKEEILEDLKERLKVKKKSAQEKQTANSNPSNSNKEFNALSSSYFERKPASFNVNGQSYKNEDPSSQANMQDYCNDNKYNTSEGHNFDPALYSLLM
ncbi:hypothetical protein PCASD_10351 [Puccinia coronata f. sp. avenae]|uniref:Uncharacterized protein n=1 Tax=Puccinia coronata f. sp. avenae TaxID=200324 RepID=A0A2N5ULB8_9BASI|nr:hypothetical protein PCASD_10351 [Puccinia coronata f. sp. avenae]